MSRKKKSGLFIVDVDIYKRSVVFSICQTEKQIRQELSKHPVDDLDGLISAINPNNAGKYYAITATHSGDVYVFFNPNGMNKGTIAHEIFHATCYITKHIGLPLTAESEEAYAYLLGYITVEFYKQLKKDFDYDFS